MNKPLKKSGLYHAKRGTSGDGTFPDFFAEGEI